MKPYSLLTDGEKITLSHDDLETSITLEAIERGIKPPLTLSKALEQEGTPSYSTPADAVFFYELMAVQSYGDAKPTGLAFKTPEEARAALNGAIAVYHEGYGADAKWKIGDAGQFAVREVAVSLSKPKTFTAQLEKFYQDNKPFETMAEECMENFREVRQQDYNRRVTTEKRENYLRLAQGNEEIAKAFWSKAERTEWPES